MRGYGIQSSGEADERLELNREVNNSQFLRQDRQGVKKDS